MVRGPPGARQHSAPWENWASALLSVFLGLGESLGGPLSP